jgi:hypothetical protein
VNAVRGRLITATFTRHVLAGVGGVPSPPPALARLLERWWDRAAARLGPASAVRAIVDGAALPLLTLLGYDVTAREDLGDTSELHTSAHGRPGPIVTVTSWNRPLDDLWRSVVLRAVACDARWALVINGPALRLVDARRTWTRDALEFNLPALSADPDACRLFWSAITASSVTGSEPLLDRLVDLSARHGVDVCRTLGAGVLAGVESLLGALVTKPHRDHDLPAVFDQSLTVLYRVLFLLFAEARGLVPLWHPVYRDRYSLDTIVTTLIEGRPCRGLWHAVRAISRLAHAGCSAGELRVTAFNGRLFAPTHAVAFERTRVADGPLAATILALSTTPPTARRGRTRIAYADLDVEQLGAVYEQVLEYEPSSTRGQVSLERTRDARKASGTFYTPRALTAHLVRRTLEPIVRDRPSDSILDLRVLDPAMGSGAFLVAACRYLAAAVEEARIREGTWHAGDIAAEDRRQLRREIAARCLYGVDSNPMAVQLARLSLWLVTLAADKPLSFLDHHLVAGDSLVGASLADVMRQPSKQTRRARPASLPLFESADLAASLDTAARVRSALACEPDDSVAIVRGKERALAALGDRDSPLARWSSVLDLWCAGWFWDAADPPNRAVFGDLAHRLLHGRSTLDSSIAAPLLDRAAAIAARRRFLHWPLVFPEVFARDRGGFDAIVGNPPWDMMRGDSGSGDVRRERRRDAELTSDFVREAGIYRVPSRAHVNRYQLFVERALQLLRPGGRVGFVLPSGIVSDGGSAALRRHLLDHADVDAIDGLDNRGAIFPIHRSLRFVLLTATTERPTTAISCRFGINRLEDLEATAANDAPLVLTRRFLERVSGSDDLGIPGIVSAADLRLLERISSRIPWLGHSDGWNVSFGRELNATDDRDAFTGISHDRLARPVLEGKQVDPFRVALERSTQELRAGDGRAQRVPRRARVAYRDVASATNRLTLIAAIVPARAVTTHTLFCLRTPLPIDQQHVLTALLNSFVANYLVRLRVSSHVTTALVARLPVPVVAPGTPAFARLHALARTLAGAKTPVEQMPEYPELQARVAHLYELTLDDFTHVLSTFPLIDTDMKDACRAAFQVIEANHVR